MSDNLYEVLDPRFASLFNGSSRLHKLFGDCQWAEGPAWFAGGRYLVWSDIPANRMLRLDEASGAVATFRQPSGNSNGNTVDRQGRLVTCEHGNRRVTRTEHDGSITVIADRFEGKRLNSPNDVVVKSDGSIWFTDPTYGIDSDYEGNAGESEIGASYVYRVDPGSGAISAVITDMVKPNGLAFSPDESLIYVADTGRSHKPDHPPEMRVFRVAGDKVSDGRQFAVCTNGAFDGFRLDTAGRIWTSAADGVHCITPEGELIGRINVPEPVANCTFGGAKNNVLYICATSSLYAIRLKVNGLKLY